MRGIIPAKGVFMSNFAPCRARATTGVSAHSRLALRVSATTLAAALIPAAPGYIGTYDAAVIFAMDAVSSASKSSILSYLLLLRFPLFFA